jgi:hypothetical protein
MLFFVPVPRGVPVEAADGHSPSELKGFGPFLGRVRGY